MLATVKDQAASYFELIVQTRIWNARYGGVYVQKKEGTGSNEYLKAVGIEPDISCNGMIYTMRNPAVMTKEISGLTGEKTGVKFHMTSLMPINPENEPDRFEQESLVQFERGMKEVWRIERNTEPPQFRYMAPLYVERSCLLCHEVQGYKEGQIRGGISVTIPIGGLIREINMNRAMIIILSMLTVSLLLGTLSFMVWKLVVRLDRSQKQLKEISITDELTGMSNRRFIMERLAEEFQRARRLEKPLGLVILDLDHFKQINDTYGHRFGDVVLKAVSARMNGSLREYDLLGRIGGEEFLIVCPDTNREGTLDVAERIRTIIKAGEITEGTTTTRMTVSAGVATVNTHDLDVDALFSRADAALYKAKQEGRDRVVAL